jgi:hypothetical protein
MKLTIEGTTDEIKKVLQVISGDQEHEIKDQKSILKSMALALAETQQKYGSSKQE